MVASMTAVRLYITSQAFTLGGINPALEAIKQRPGGFSNIVVNPDRWIARSARTQFEGELS